MREKYRQIAASACLKTIVVGHYSYVFLSHATHHAACYGFQAAAGFRYRVVHNLELSAALRYSDGSDSESSTVGDVAARYRITPMIDLYVSYQFESDMSLLGTGVALNF